jgi:hypothetical membrane protein
MKFRNILFWIFVILASALFIFMSLGIINENSRQTGAALIFFGICMLFVALLKKKPV